MRVRLKKMEVFSLKASSLSGSFASSTVIGPTWRQDTEKLEGSSLSPKGWPHPPLRACETKQATPGTAGSSDSLTQTLSLARHFFARTAPSRKEIGPRSVDRTFPHNLGWG